MEIANLALDYVQVLIWPATVMILIFVFRKEISERLKHLTNVKGPLGLGADFAAGVEEAARRREESSQQLALPDQIVPNGSAADAEAGSQANADVDQLLSGLQHARRKLNYDPAGAVLAAKAVVWEAGRIATERRNPGLTLGPGYKLNEMQLDDPGGQRDLEELTSLAQVAQLSGHIRPADAALYVNLAEQTTLRFLYSE